MSIPQGSKVITHLEYTKLYYLNNLSGNAAAFSNSDFNVQTGKPLNNISTSTTVDSFFVNTLKNSLQEGHHVNKRFVFDYPQVLETDSMRDLEISGETVIDAVFIHEGASMKNMVGYYFYTINGDGNKVLLDNSDNNTDNSEGYYRPTIIFPHVYSEDGDNSTLQQGDMRTLRGNLVNGNFENIHVGFFLVPHGWLALSENGVYSDELILYSTLDFGYDYNVVDDNLSNERIYSVYAKAKSESGDELLFVAFEDIFFDKSTNMDYNDCVIGFTVSDVNNIVGFNDYPVVEIESKEDTNNILFINNSGEYIKLDINSYAIDYTKDYIFERCITFENTTDCQSFYDVYIQLLHHFNYDVEKVSDKLTLKYLLRTADIQRGRLGNNVTVYLFKSKYNNGGLINKYQKEVGKLLKKGCTETYQFYERLNTQNKLIELTTPIDKPRPKYNSDSEPESSINSSSDSSDSDTENNFQITGSGKLNTINGVKVLPKLVSQIYKVYKNVDDQGKGLVINVKMDDHPTGYLQNKKYFVGWVSFHVDNNQLLIVNLNSLDLYDGNMTLNNQISFTDIDISPITSNSEAIKNKIKIFRNDSGALYRTVVIKEYLTFYCIRFPNIKNNPTMVYLDFDIYLKWADKSNILDGTYYFKKNLYPINNFSEY